MYLHLGLLFLAKDSGQVFVKLFVGPIDVVQLAGRLEKNDFEKFNNVSVKFETDFDCSICAFPFYYDADGHF